MDVATIRRTPASEGSVPPETPTVPLPEADHAERVAAQQRYDTFTSGGDADPSAYCTDPIDPRYDFDRCGTKSVEHAALFVREATETNEIEPLDVEQGHIGDCYLMAVLLAMTRSPEGRAIIHSAIRENRNDRGEVDSYTVTLHKPETHLLGLAKTTFTDVPVTVTGQYATYHAVPRDGGSVNEVWPLVMEKAFAQYCGGYNAVGHGGYPAEAMEVLTGRTATQTKLGWFSTYGQDELTRDLAAGKLIVLSTRTDARSFGLVETHAYVVTGTDCCGGKPCVVLDNPWGKGKPLTVPIADLRRYFHTVTVGSVS